MVQERRSQGGSRSAGRLWGSRETSVWMGRCHGEVRGWGVLTGFWAAGSDHTIGGSCLLVPWHLVCRWSVPRGRCRLHEGEGATSLPLATWPSSATQRVCSVTPPPKSAMAQTSQSVFPPPEWFIPAGGRALRQAAIQGRRSLLSGGFSFFCTRGLYSCVSAGRSTRRFDGPGRVGASVPPPRPHLTGKEPGTSRRHAARRRHGSDGHPVAVGAVGRQATTERTKPQPGPLSQSVLALLTACALSP